MPCSEKGKFDCVGDSELSAFCNQPGTFLTTLGRALLTGQVFASRPATIGSTRLLSIPSEAIFDRPPPVGTGIFGSMQCSQRGGPLPGSRNAGPIGRNGVDSYPTACRRRPWDGGRSLDLRISTATRPQGRCSAAIADPERSSSIELARHVGPNGQHDWNRRAGSFSASDVVCSDTPRAAKV